MGSASSDLATFGPCPSADTAASRFVGDGHSQPFGIEQRLEIVGPKCLPVFQAQQSHDLSCRARHMAMPDNLCGDLCGDLCGQVLQVSRKPLTISDFVMGTFRN